MTKDLALLVGPDQEFQTTQEFLASIDENLQAAVPEGEASRPAPPLRRFASQPSLVEAGPEAAPPRSRAAAPFRCSPLRVGERDVDPVVDDARLAELATDPVESVSWTRSRPGSPSTPTRTTPQVPAAFDQLRIRSRSRSGTPRRPGGPGPSSGSSRASAAPGPPGGSATASAADASLPEITRTPSPASTTLVDLGARLWRARRRRSYPTASSAVAISSNGWLVRIAVRPAAFPLLRPP